MVEEMYKEAIECLEDCIKNQPCECRNEMRLAIEAIEKQIPKKPFQIVKHTDYFHWECPICHMSYGMATVKVRHCPNCGQAIKW